MTSGVRLAVWSGPRSISTALMRSWGNRPDCRVVDEPLYACYLLATGADHPLRDEVLAAGESSWEVVVAGLTAPADGISYQKHMAHHLAPGIRRDWIEQLSNILLIRDPVEVIDSYLRTRPSVDEADLGLIEQSELAEQLGPAAPIVDSGDLLGHPEGYLRWMCAFAGVDFLDCMLAWPPGLRPTDGVWAGRWYGAVAASTGFEPARPRRIRLEGEALAVADRVRPIYERLHAGRVRL